MDRYIDMENMFTFVHKGLNWMVLLSTENMLKLMGKKISTISCRKILSILTYDHINTVYNSGPQLGVRN